MIRRWWRPGLVAFAAIVLVLWAAAHAGSALVVSREVGPPDAIIILASHEWERLPPAAALARQFPSSTIFLTVPRTVTRFNCHMCSERVAWLGREGIEARRVVVLPDRVGNTYDEAVSTRNYLQAHPAHRLVVVTSPYHARRALSTFSRVLAGTDVEVGLLPASGTSIAQPTRWWWGPYDRSYVAYEWTGLLYYRWKYGVPLNVPSGSRPSLAGSQSHQRERSPLYHR